MKIKLVLAIALMSLGLTAVQAYAETEGAGNPFPFRKQTDSFFVKAFTADTNSEAYQDLTGRPTQQPSPTRMAAAAGSEAAVQSADSMTRGFEEGTVAYTQARSLERYAASRRAPVHVAKTVLAAR